MRFIECGHEGSYWDFKEQWYSDRSDMLHDIICMANCIENRDSYIIIGVNDDCTQFGYDNNPNAPKRWDTQELNCFLRDKDFMGDLRPSVHVVPLSISEKKIDVIVIENSKNTPFILNRDYRIDNRRTVYKYHVYSRVQDSNTPIDKNADINIVESLWRKRFRIDATPFEKLEYYLKSPDDWELDYNSYRRGSYYYKFDPAFTISFAVKEEDEFEACGPDFLCKDFTDPINDGYYTAQFKIYESVIKESLYSNCDGGRYRAIYPCREGIAIDASRICYLHLTYVIRDSFEDLFYNFIRQKENNGYSRECNDYHDEYWWKNVIYFDSEQEKEMFKEYILGNKESMWKKYTNIKDSKYVEKEQYGKYEWNRGDSVNWRSIQLLKQEYEKFIKQEGEK